MIGLADPLDAGISHAQMANELGIELVNGKLPAGVEGFFAQKLNGGLQMTGAGIANFKLSDSASALLNVFFK